jgi:hypothetical protein
MMQKPQPYKMEDAFFICQLQYPVVQKKKEKKRSQIDSAIFLFSFSTMTE